jgi:two-component system sensor histidine kinase KdpD
MVIAAIGVLTVAVMFMVTGDAPAFGWTDVFFLTTYALVVAGFASLPHTQGSPMQRWRMLLDGMIGAVSVGALMWVFVLTYLVVDLADTSIASRTIGAFYPFFDLLAISVAMSVLLRRSAHRFDVRLTIFSVGILAQVLGDIAFFASGHANSFDEAQPLYIINLVAVSAFFVAASLVGTPTGGREYADRNPPLWTQVAPYVPAVGMLVVFLVHTLVDGDADVEPVLLGATIVVGLLVIARQGVAILENRALIEQQRNDLVSTISHELRTPLTAIVGFVELLEEDDNEMSVAERRSMLDVVHQQADYMARIVSDLIMLARGADNTVDLRVGAASMSGIIASSIQASGLPTATVRVDCPPDVIGYVDAARIQQVLVNLLTNAARYGGPARLVRVVVKGSDLVLEVHDDGPGIPRRHELRVWERFERGPNRLNAAVPGSGIGLAVVQAIAQAHGGTARYVRSADLGGACIIVTLPGRAGVGAEVLKEARRPVGSSQSG